MYYVTFTIIFFSTVSEKLGTLFCGTVNNTNNNTKIQETFQDTSNCAPSVFPHSLHLAVIIGNRLTTKSLFFTNREHYRKENSDSLGVTQFGIFLLCVSVNSSPLLLTHQQLPV